MIEKVNALNELPGVVVQFPYIGLFILIIAGGLGLPFPEDATLILSGFLISHNIAMAVPALLTVYFAVIIADVILYSFGRRFGPKVTGHPRFSRLLSKDRLEAIEDTFRKRGVTLILVGRHLVGLRAQLFIVAGVMKMPIPVFIAADACSSLITIAFMVGAGYLGGDSLQVLRKDLSRIEHAAIVLFVAALALFVVVRYFRSRRA